MTVSASSVRLVVMAATVAAVFELVVLRVLTRTAAFIPGISERIGVVNAVGELGRLGYFVSLTLLATGLVCLAVLSLRHGSAAGSVLAVALLAFGAFALAARLDWIPRIAADIVTLGTVVALASLVRPRRRVVAISLAAFSLAFVVAGIDAVWRNGGGTAPVGMGGLLLAEWLVLVAAIAMIVAHRHGSGRALLGGALLGGVLVVAFMLASATVRILLLWNIGLPGGLPAVAYGVVAMAVVVAIVNAAQRGQLATVAGVCLLVAGGIGLQSTYQSGLAVLGLAVLALRDVLAGETWPVAATPSRPPSSVRDRRRRLDTVPESRLTEELR